MRKRFGYLKDPLFLACLIGYAVNRFLLKPNFDWRFLHEHLNDLICIPFWLPIMLWTQRAIGLRDHDGPPSAIEIVIPLIAWSWAFEIWLPGTGWFGQWCTGDPVDVLAYAAGAFGAAIFWRWRYEAAVASPSTAGAQRVM